MKDEALKDGRLAARVLGFIRLCCILDLDRLLISPVTDKNLLSQDSRGISKVKYLQRVYKLPALQVNSTSFNVFRRGQGH